MEEVIIGDENSFKGLKKDIKHAGKEKFHVVVDFDRTLTYCFYNGKKASSVVAQLRNGKYLTSDYAEKSHALFDKYHPIEIDAEVSMIEKIVKMREWWKKHFELLVECGLDEETIAKAVEDMIKEDTLGLRKGVSEFIKFLNKKNIPLIIMSASGVGNMVKLFLEKQGLLLDNVHLIVNMLEFDKTGKFKGIEDKKIIHVFNKHEVEFSVKGLEDRKNVLLLGDSLGDLGMVGGSKLDNVIKIGFLNENAEENLSLFNENFDVILTGDGNFSFVNGLVKELVG